MLKLMRSIVSGVARRSPPKTFFLRKQLALSHSAYRARLN
jgi:hypothetical protein